MDLSDNGQALDAIREVGPGSHFLGCAHTQANFETAFFRSALADNNSVEQWEAEGLHLHALNQGNQVNPKNHGGWWLEVDWSRRKTPVPYLPNVFALEPTGLAQWPHAFFDRELATGPRAPVIDIWAARLAPGMIGAALHRCSQWARITLAAPVSLTAIETLYEKQLVETQAVAWDEKTQSVRASRQRRLGALVLAEQNLSKPDPSLIAAALLQGVRDAGLAALAWTPELRQWQARVRFLRRAEGAGSSWPDLSDDALMQTLDRWLGPFLDGITTLDRVKRLDLAPPLHALLTWEQQRQLDRDAPAHVTVPSGSHIRIDYESGDVPVLAVRLQEMFGCTDTPRIAGGTVPVMLHLLSPAKRPVQVTKDLASFWKSAYVEVKKELRGRYPKHHWPDDPLAALPTAKTKRRTP